MIWYWIIVGLRDSNLSERLQTDPELTLEKAITMAWWTEAVREQQIMVRGEIDNTCTRIEEVEHSYSNKKLWIMFQVSKIPKQPTRKVTLDVAVSNTSKCMARKTTCRKCKKQGHYQSVCRSVTNLALIWTNTVNKEPFLGTIKIVSTHNKDNQQTIELLLNGKPIHLKIDTGADVTLQFQKNILETGWSHFKRNK